MDEFLTDQQQAIRVRGWVREYAPAAIVALAVGVGGYFGYSQWQKYQDDNAAAASDLYEQFTEALDSDDGESTAELLDRLATDYAGSSYLDHARLLLAREYVDTTRPSLAAEELQSVIATTKDDDLRQLARLRLARVFLYMDRLEEGLSALESEDYPEAWEQMTADMRGDLYRALGQTEEARTAYQAALDSSGQVNAGWIRLKLDYLGAVAAAGESEPAQVEDEPAQEEDAAQEESAVAEQE